MKTFRFLVVLFFVFILDCKSQTVYTWYNIPSGTNQDLNSIYYNIITGNNGVILANVTANGWTLCNTGTTNNLYGIYLPSSGSPIVCGNSGTLLTPFGNIFNWILIQSGTTKNLFSISKSITSFPAIQRYIAVGETGTIISSTDNGSNWSVISSPVSTDLKSVFFVQDNLPLFKCGWITGNNGVILKTTDGGGSWTQRSSGITQNLNSIYFKDSLTGFIVGNSGIILKSTDRGETWTPRQSVTTNNFNSIYYYGSLNNGGWIAGDNGLVLNTTNAGDNWTPESNFTNVDLKSFYYDNQNGPIVVGKNGKIFDRQIDSSYFFCRKIFPNNTSAYYSYTGIFDINYNMGLRAGFEWPKGSGKTAVFTAGLSLAAYVNEHLAQSMASYQGEFAPGYCRNGNFYTDNRFKIYIVKRGDNAQSNPDWANWGLMVPFGAPFIDVNNNRIYEPAIDTPGVKNAAQTLFACYTDANFYSHNPGEGFGGGITSPLLCSEIHLTAWGYNQTNLQDVQFVKWEIINKGLYAWNNLFMSIVSDPDLGDAFDDYIGCDTLRNLSFCYNSTNSDAIYGANPPAFGFRILKGGLNKSVNPPYEFGFTSFIHFIGNGQAPPPCESEPNGEPYPAYLFMQGFKKDSTSWMDVSQTPPKRTKFIYSGDPETNTGWTEYKGSMYNCNRDTTGVIIPTNPAGDRKFVMSSGANNFSVLPNDTQTIIVAQMIARGSSNLNSVTMLKLLADSVLNFYNSYLIDTSHYSPPVPTDYFLYQNYPNPFNNKSIIKFEIPYPSEVKLIVYDILGREIKILVNEVRQPGFYEAIFDGTNFASGVYLYRLQASNFTTTKRMVLIK
jgi:hypothetical protein